MATKINVTKINVPSFINFLNTASADNKQILEITKDKIYSKGTSEDGSYIVYYETELSNVMEMNFPDGISKLTFSVKSFKFITDHLAIFSQSKEVSGVMTTDVADNVASISKFTIKDEYTKADMKCIDVVTNIISDEVWAGGSNVDNYKFKFDISSGTIGKLSQLTNLDVRYSTDTKKSQTFIIRYDGLNIQYEARTGSSWSIKNSDNIHANSDTKYNIVVPAMLINLINKFQLVSIYMLEKSEGVYKFIMKISDKHIIIIGGTKEDVNK